MPGIIALYPFGLGRENWKIARFVYYGLMALQHRGQETASLAVLGRGGMRVLEATGPAEEAFELDDLGGLDGFIALGRVSPLPRDSLASSSSPIELVVAGDGCPELDGERDWRAFAEVLSDEMSRVGDPLRASVNVIERARGGYSFVAITAEQIMLAGRDPRGIKPLEVGSLGFDIGAVASESCALDVLGMEHAGSVKPGEVLKLDPYSIERARARPRGSDPPSLCSFELVYLARHDSVVDGIDVYAVREKIGARLAREAPAEADVVIGVPETATPFALGYAKASGTPASLGFVTTGRRLRTALKPSALERLIGVQLKLNPIRCAVEGRDVVLIDDSVVRGTTLRNTVWNLKRRGARRVHVRIGSPPLRSPCPYDPGSTEPDELIARSLSPSEIAEVVGADSLAFISEEGLAESAGLPTHRLCMLCWRAGEAR
ncbi:MAG: amidophosphoribosyltransferase [Fervidicoccaceae archaeon]